ncbi:MAG TPA: ABC transporter substrate-binding protein [Stellaceae bacterium]|jgi:NitT/TauT family transport system substrate-binding protein|nr:ABC transporter substrate-binding protein [Stellaceae bacterium]
MRLRLFENYRFVLYAPFYAAHATGAYDAEGLEVELLTSPGAGKAEAALIAGDADVMWAGPMRVIKHHDGDPGSPLVCFAEIVCRDPFSIIGRDPNPGFRLADLATMRLGTVSEVPTPWLCLQQDLREAGLDPDRLDRVGDRGMADNLASLRAGRLDAAQVFEPVVEQALASGAAHLWHAASSRGRTTYTAFVTTRDRLLRDAEPLLRMVRAIHRTQQWLHAEPAATIAATIASYFPALEPAVLAGAVARYRAQGVWGTDPLLPEAGYERLRRGLVSGGFVGRAVPYRDCVDNSVAERASGPTAQ